MVKAVGARTCWWLWRASLSPHVLGVLGVALMLHLMVLPTGSTLGGIARAPLEILAGLGRGRGCRGGPYPIVILAPDGRNGWQVAEDQEDLPGSVWVYFRVRTSRSGFGASTSESTWRTLSASDPAGTPVTLTPGAAGVARKWIEENYAWGLDFDEALAGRVLTYRPIITGHAQNAVLALQAACVGWCFFARGRVRAIGRIEQRRLAAGECRGCGYPRLETTSACPECGGTYGPR